MNSVEHYSFSRDEPCAETIPLWKKVGCWPADASDVAGSPSHFHSGSWIDADANSVSISISSGLERISYGDRACWCWMNDGKNDVGGGCLGTCPERIFSGEMRRIPFVFGFGVASSAILWR